MLYQLDSYYKSLFKNKYIYFILKRKLLKKIRFIIYYASFAFIRKKILVKK